MKKKLLALSALTLACGAVQAQSSVTVYGSIDLGLLVQSNAGNGTTQLYNGGIAPSTWGLRGTEDLGGGNKVNFNLESHFSADTGAGTASLFRRSSNIGFSSSSMGTLTLGNIYSPAVLAFAATDPRGLRENFSGLFPWAYNSGLFTAGNNGNNDAGCFLQNAIEYSNTLGPVGIAGAYSISETKGSVVSLGLTYSGPVSLSAAYQAANFPSSSEDQSVTYTLGAGYTMGAFTGKLNLLNSKNRNAALVETTKVNVLGLGLDWKTTENNTIGLAYYTGKDKNMVSSTTNSFILSDEYALSKRTTLYVQAAFVDAAANASLVSSIVAGGTDAGKNASLLNFGIKHTF